MAIKKTIRSISLPSRSHPTTLRVEEELNKLKSAIPFPSESPSGSSLCLGLSGLQQLYISMNDVLNMPSTKELISRFRSQKCLDDLLDASVRLLDLCGLSRDALLQLKEHVQSLQSAIRRRKGEFESSIWSYNCLRKKMKRDAKKFVFELKQLETEGLNDQQVDSHLIELFKEAFVMNSLVFQCLMQFLTAPTKPKQSGWLIISKLVHRGIVRCEDKQGAVNEIAGVDSVLSERFDSENVGIAQKRLEDLEMFVEEAEKCLEGVFRHLIKTRASILNIISL